MVGRQGEVQALSDALGRALAGEQATIVVGGEAGVGKSRLVQELLGQTREAGARVLVGSCIELDGAGIPFAPVVEMMRDLAADLPAGELDAARQRPHISAAARRLGPGDPLPHGCATHRTCTSAALILSGTFNRHADGERIRVTVRLRTSGGHVRVYTAQTRVTAGHWRVRITLVTRGSQPNRPSTFRVRYAGDLTLASATITGGTTVK